MLGSAILPPQQRRVHIRNSFFIVAVGVFFRFIDVRASMIRAYIIQVAYTNITMGYNTKSLSADYEHSMLGHLGMKLIETDSDEVVKASMPVNELTCQPFGVLCGGASIALAEVLAGYGSWRLIAEDELPVGAQVSANHVSSVRAPSVVIAEATILHRGKRTHLWNVDVKTEDGKLVSTARVLNSIIKVKA